jgi:hypothetical protein
MATRKQNWHTEETRQKIQTSQLINRLTSHAFGEVELSTTQVKAIDILLKKALPDLQSISAEITGANGGPIETKELSSLEMARRIGFLLEKGKREVKE